MKTYYYYQALRKTITQFLDVFNDIKIKRYDESGNFIRYITVPIKFAPKERAYYYIFENHQDEMLPMISVTMNSIEFASDRMGSNYHVLTKSMQECQVSQFLNPVPYNLGFTVYLWTKYMSDIDQILEQSLAYFAPHIFIRITIPEVDFSFDVKVVFTGASPDMQTDMSEEERRVIRYTMDFSVHTYLFRPVEDSGVIKTIYINYYTNLGTFDAALADTTSLFSSAASGESQVFSGLGECSQIEDEKIYNYEIYNHGDKIGPPIGVITMPPAPPPITPPTWDDSANLGYSDLIAEISEAVVTIICMGYDSGLLAIENFDGENFSIAFNAGSEYFEIESGKYLAVTEDFIEADGYNLSYDATSDNPFTLELYKGVEETSYDIVNRTSDDYYGRQTYGTWTGEYWQSGISGGTTYLWLRTELAPSGAIGASFNPLFWANDFFPDSIRINYTTTGSNPLNSVIQYTPYDTDGYASGLFTLYEGEIANNTIINLDWSAKDGDDPEWNYTYRISRLNFSMTTDVFQIHSIEYISAGGDVIGYTLYQSWDASLTGETYDIENATATIESSAASFYTVLKNTHESCSVITITPSSSIIVDEGGGGGEPIQQNFETAQDAMEWAEENLTHDGYNTPEDISTMTIGSGAYGAIYYYNLNNGAVWDGDGSTIQSSDAQPTDDYYWASYIKTGIHAYALQWSGTLTNTGTTTYDITPWHWSQTLFVIRNDSPTTLTFNIMLVAGDVVA
jgi:hypothetical protein